MTKWLLLAILLMWVALGILRPAPPPPSWQCVGPAETNHPRCPRG